MHCSVMGREALQAAVANYRGEEWSDDHEEGALVCKCFAIDDVMVRDTIKANNLSSVEEVTNYTKAGGGCSSCHEAIENILSEELAARGEVFTPAGSGKKKQAAKKSDLVEIEAPAPAAASGGMTLVQRIRKIEEVLEALRPALKADNGDVELVDVDGKVVYVNLVGACSGCQMAAMTLGGIQQKLIEALGEFIKVIPASERPAVA